MEIYGKAAGKGDSRRPTNEGIYRKNFSDINWHHEQPDPCGPEPCCPNPDIRNGMCRNCFARQAQL
jgi:hypothetical protein